MTKGPLGPFCFYWRCESAERRVPQHLQKTWKLFSINAGYYLVSLQVMGMILACWR